MGRYLGHGMKVLPVVPLFHVNAWGLPYGAPLTGTSLVFPGSNLDGASLFKLIDNEHVNSNRAQLFQTSFTQALGVAAQSRAITDTERGGLDEEDVA